MTMQGKVLAFEQLPELIKNLAERVESLEKTVRDKQQPSRNSTIKDCSIYCRLEDRLRMPNEDVVETTMCADFYYLNWAT